MNDDTRAWVEALRSGEYTQAQGAMMVQDAQGKTLGNCCLGVAAVVLLTPDEGDPFEFNYTDEEGNQRFGVRHEDGEISTGYLPDELNKRLGMDPGDNDELAGLNDEGASFDTIADLIEQAALHGTSIKDTK